MRLRVTYFPGLRIQLDRGWYVVPSHLRPAEIERLVDVLSSGIDAEPPSLFVDWWEIDAIPDALDAVVYVRVPEQVESGAAERALARIDVRVGLMQYIKPGRWPEVAWDELEVKSALVSWWRREISQPNHPLRNLDIEQLPLDVLAAATSEPVEFLELVDTTIVIRFESRLSWLESTWQSIALRLQRRLRGLRQQARDRLIRSGDAWPFVAGEDDELVRAGLVMEANGRVVSSPLVRMLENEEVVSAMGQRKIESSLVALGRTGQGVGTFAFEHVGPLEPLDEWFVDIDAELPAELSVRLRILMHIREARRVGRFASVVLAHQNGSGGSTRIRATLARLAAEGVVAILVDVAGTLNWKQALSQALADWTLEHSIVANSARDEDLIAAIHDHLVERGQQLCVVIDGREHSRGHYSFWTRVYDTILRTWPCHWICTANVIDGISDLEADGHGLVWMSSLPVRTSVGQRIVRKLLDKRVLVAEVFEDTSVSALAERSGGHLAHLFELTRLSILAAGDKKVGPRHLEEATTALSQVLSARIAPRDWWRLERLNGMKGAPTEFMEKGDEHLFLDSLLLAHGAEPQWTVHPLVHRLSPFRRTENLPSPSILYVGITPPSYVALDLQGESAIIRRALGDLGSLHVLMNVTVEDVRKVVIERGYEVLHLAGHGSGEGVLLVDEKGTPLLLPSARIPLLWSDSSLRCVILSYAESVSVINAAKTRPFVVVLTAAIEDAAALVFARGFYERLAVGKPIPSCFAEARTRLGLAGYDPDAFVLFEPKPKP